MNWKKTIYLIALVSLVAMVIVGCIKWGESVPSTNGQTTRPEGWTEETHSNNAAPNYDIVFPQDKVNQIKITIAPSDWEAMQVNMTELLGPGGTGQRGGFAGAPGPLPDRGEMAPGNFTPEGGAVPEITNLPPDQGEINTINITLDNGGAPRAPGMPGWADMTLENPMWIPATISFDGLTWTNVGVRYKGHSSLMSGWRSGTLKLPLKLDFDEFEDEYPAISNQRFYGFKQLSLSNSFADSTYMRDVISADLLEEAGLVAAETAYYEVILDYGEGPVNLGLYIMIEAIDDTVIDRVFGDDSGNIYEGEGPGTSLAQGTFNQIEDSFLKENNEVEADWSDIEALYTVLHSEQRVSDSEAWRESLESIFDVDVFLEWLAISTVIEHWDSYGSMPHNFYLYHDPDTDLLTWISWDHNEVLGIRGGREVSGGGMGLERNEVGQNWPLIRYLLDDSVYYALYIDYIQKTVDGVFNPEELETECWQTAALIDSYAVKESGEAAFESAVQELINRIYERYEAATNFLTSELGN